MSLCSKKSKHCCTSISQTWMSMYGVCVLYSVHAFSVELIYTSLALTKARHNCQAYKTGVPTLHHCLIGNLTSEAKSRVFNNEHKSILVSYAYLYKDIVISSL